LYDISLRLPIFAAVACFFTFSEDMYPFPISLSLMNGPSMLPTIYPVGDIIVLDTVRHKLPFGIGGRDFRKGDVIILRDWKKQYVCKRIIAVGGEKVSINGEFASTLFSHMDDLGIRPVDPSQIPIPEWKSSLVKSSNRKNSLIVVPEGHVWVEGDNPLFSIDSRHYGPVRLSDIKFRAIKRFWPIRRTDLNNVASNSTNDISFPSIASGLRPKPLSSEELFNGAFNLYLNPSVGLKEALPNTKSKK